MRSTQMIHTEEFARARPDRGAAAAVGDGSEGQGRSRSEIADGVITIGGGVEGIDWCVQMVNGTVLDPGEDFSTPRVKDAAGPWFVLAYHGAWQMAGAGAVDGLPLGAEWRAAIEAERVEGERHLAVHEGHVGPGHGARPRGARCRRARCSSGFGWIGGRDVGAGTRRGLRTPPA